MTNQNGASNIIRKEAAASAAINFALNAAINAWMLQGKGPHTLTVDSITAKTHTVFSSAVPLALMLSVILATITFHTFRKKALTLSLAPAGRLSRPYFFFGLRHALSTALFMFGAVVAAGVIWQRFAGSVEVSTPVAATITGLVAGVSAAYAIVTTSRALLRED